jgi:outer membrane protein assembly factor BamA
MWKFFPAIFLASVSSAATIREIKIEADSVGVDAPQLVDILGFKEGDTFSQSNLDRGLIRIVETGKIAGLKASFDEAQGLLLVRVREIPRVNLIDIRIVDLPEDYESLKNEVKEVLGVSVGDPITSEEMAILKNRITSRLRDRGFRSSRVLLTLEEKVDVPGLSVVASVELGMRQRTSKILFRGFSPRDAEELASRLDVKMRHFSEYKSEHQWAAKIEKPFDTILFDEALIAWAKEERDLGFFDFNVKYEHPPADEVSVDAIFELSRGFKYDVQFKGNVEFWERDLRAQVTDRPRRLGTLLNVSEIEASLKKLYLDAGFPDVSVKTAIVESGEKRQITLNIVEGKKRILGPIAVAGIPQEAQFEIEKVIQKWLFPLKSPVKWIPYNPQLMQEETPRLLKLIRGLGYLDAKVLEIKGAEDVKTRKVPVTISLQLGQKIKARSVSVTGNLSLTQKELDEIVTLAPGEPVDILKLANIQDALVNQYKNDGFLEVAVSNDESQVIHRVFESDEADIEFSVDQGPLFKVGRLVVEGLQRTKEKVISRELRENTLKSGQDWTPNGARELETRLLNLGILGSADIKPVGGRILQKESPEGSPFDIREKDLKIRVIERPGGSIEFGPGFRTDRGLIAFGEFNYRNLGGWNRSTQLRSQVSQKFVNARFIEQNYSFTYLEPWVLDQRIRFRFNTQYEKSDRNVVIDDVKRSGYSSETSTVRFGADTELFPGFRIAPNLYSLEFARVFDVDPQQRFRIATIGGVITWDLRDNIFNPSKGWYFSSLFEYSSPEIGSRSLDGVNADVSFSRVTQEVTKYFPLNDDGVVFARFGGYTRLSALKGEAGIPLTKRPALGGASSIRSLKEGALRLEQKGIGNQDAFEYKAELRQPILPDLGIAFFVDGGQILGTAEDLDTKELRRYSTGPRAGFGAGIRYKTPVGPIALDTAFNANPKVVQGGREDDIRFNLSIGAF